MSSEGSVSSNGSRIRQFGLYRTIDARTEEFLKSSRKRQIRQGCACAAISTAITVTVVVSVILVYEYSINSEGSIIKKNSFKPNWIGLINDNDITSISSKFNKKINFDRTTLKLLPILLKALNKNQYLEKILEEYSSSSSPYIGKYSTEATFTRNIFSDTKNWLKLQTTRHSTTDHKTSPLMPWNNPTQRLEYLTKIRKIRDYQRMLNYFDKMINDKVGLNQKKEFEYTENPLTVETVPMTKRDKKNGFISKIRQVSDPVQNVSIHSNGIKSKEIKSKINEGLVCNCSKKLGLLLSKLITVLQDVVPQAVGNEIVLTTCRSKIKHIDYLSQLTTARTVRPTKLRANDSLTTVTMGSIRKTTENISKETKASRNCCCPTYHPCDSDSTSTTPSLTTTITKQSMLLSLNELENKTFEGNKTQMPLIMKIKTPNYQTFEKTSLGYDPLDKTTVSTFTQTTKRPTSTHPTIEANLPMKIIAESSTEKWLKKYTLDSSYSRLNVPLFKEEEYDDYFNNKVQSKESSRAKTISREDMVYGKRGNKNNMKKVSVYANPINDHPGPDTNDLDLTSMRKLANINPISNHQEPEQNGLDLTSMRKLANINPINNHPEPEQTDLDLTSMRKLANMIYVPHEKNTKVWKYTIQPDPSAPLVENKHPRLQSTSTSQNLVKSSLDPTTSNILTSSLKNFIQITDSTTPDVKHNNYETTVKYKPHLLNTDQQISDNGGDDEFQDEYLRPIESPGVPYKYRKSIKKMNTTTLETTKPWHLLKNDEKTVSTPLNSMLPPMRPIYLEIQRNNEWRLDEHGDYDNYNF